MSDTPSSSTLRCQPTISNMESLVFPPHSGVNEAFDGVNTGTKRRRLDSPQPKTPERLEDLQMQLLREQIAKVRAERQLAVAAKQREDLHRVKLQWEVEKLKVEKYKVTLEIRNMTTNTDFTEDNDYS